MLDEIQRFEYLVWFKGEYINPGEIGDAVKAFLATKDVEPLQAQYGTIMVPEEDVGEGPYGPYQSSTPTASKEDS